ncbi:MAG: transcriptional regulator, partial [Pseudomonadota bacterium]
VGRLGKRFAYHLTPSGEALQTTLLAMYQWSNEHFYGPDKAPVELRELASGKPLAHLAVRDAEGRPLTRRDLIAVPGPGASKATKRRLAIFQPPTD